MKLRLEWLLIGSALLAGCAVQKPMRFARAYDLNKPGIRIGAFADCDSEWISRKIFNKAEIVPFDDVERGCLSLLSERIDAFVYDSCQSCVCGASAF